MLGCLSSGRLEALLDHAAEVKRRIRLEFTVELPLLKARWKQILFGAVFQYVHAMSTQLAHRMHEPMEQPLGDIGFKYLPELGLRNAWMSESIFLSLFIPFILWTFSPFVTARKRFYTAVLYARLLMVLTVCQMLRIISFTVTQLPAPNYHCRAGEATAVRAKAAHWWNHIVVDLGTQATHGCGDLIFSSHTTFVLVGMLTYTEYGSRLLVKVVAWCGVAFMGLCIVASRKHYSVDVVVAWYTVPLVFYAMHRRWTTQRPVKDYWPHRPLIGDDGAGGDEQGDVEMGALGGQSSGEAKSEHKPLLPVVSHSRTGSREIRNGGGPGKPPAPGGKEPMPGGAGDDAEPKNGIPRNPSVANIRPRNIVVVANPQAESDRDLNDSPSSRGVGASSSQPSSRCHIV